MSIDGNKEVVQGQHAIIGAEQAKSAVHTHHPDAQWFANAGLGAFLHWGITSTLGESDLSWSMMYGEKTQEGILKFFGTQGVQRCLTPREYWAQAEHFQPDCYNPRFWTDALKQAGFSYAVLTTKHHDGFALWPSEYGDFNTKNFLGGRDFVAEYVAACRESGLKVGLYYSPPDWYANRDRMSFNMNSSAPRRGMDHEILPASNLSPSEQERRDLEIVQYLRGQITELLTRWGKIDLLWFDGAAVESKQLPLTIDEIRALQPGIVINPRLHGQADYDTPEGVFPAQRPEGWWELCHCWNEGGWGYRSHEIYKPTGWLVAELAKVRAWGGNFLPNLAPNGHGELPPVAYQRLQELARWMEHSGESVIGTTGGEWPDACNVPLTHRAGASYLHLSWVFDGIVEWQVNQKPQEAVLLRTGEEVPFTYEDRTLRLRIPPTKMSLLGEVIRVR